MTNTNKQIEELSANQAMNQLYNKIDFLDDVEERAKILKSFLALKNALIKKQKDQRCKLQEFNDDLHSCRMRTLKLILQNEVIR